MTELEKAAPTGGNWDGAEEWMPLAWALCADECGEEACAELVWEGGPIPEPWGDRWLKYEGEAKRLIALVREHVPAMTQTLATTVPVQAGEADERAVDKAWGRFSIAMGDSTGSPYPGMAKAFEEHFGQSWLDKDWRTEQSVWASAWRKAWDASASLHTQPATPSTGNILMDAFNEVQALKRQATPEPKPSMSGWVETSPPPERLTWDDPATPERKGEPVGAFLGYTYQGEIDCSKEPGRSGAFWSCAPDDHDEAIPVYAYTSPQVPEGLDLHDLTDRLVAISAAVADSDDRAAQAMLSEALRMLDAARKGG